MPDRLNDCPYPCRGYSRDRLPTIRARARVTCTVLFLLIAAPGFTEEITVQPGDSIQSVIDDAGPGDVIRFEPDTYNEPLTLRTNGVTLVGESEHGERAILDGQGAQLEMIRVEADDVRIQGFVVRNAMAAGVVVFQSNEGSLNDLIVEDNGYIGVHIADSMKIEVDRVATSGHGSAGVLIAQSSQVRVAASHSFDNLTGIRVENSNNFTIENNTLSRNATGIGLVTVPGRAKPATEYGKVLYNRVFDNNRPSTADPGTVDAAMIPGVGLFIVAADHIEAAYNRFERNNTYAAITVNLLNSGLPDSDGLRADVTTDHLYVHHNRYVDNGTDASPEFTERFPDQPAGDLYWDATGERNQWQESGEFRTVPEDLVQQQGGAHTNVIHFI